MQDLRQIEELKSKIEGTVVLINGRSRPVEVFSEALTAVKFELAQL